MPFMTLTDEEENELYRLQSFYWQEALRCEQVKAYLAGCVMLGSALETLLILMINCHSDEAERTGKHPVLRGKAKQQIASGAYEGGRDRIEHTASSAFVMKAHESCAACTDLTMALGICSCPILRGANRAKAN
jgi:hypothetical protein